MGLQLFNMENSVKVLEINATGIATEGAPYLQYTFTVDKTLSGLPKDKVKQAIEKALNKVKPLDIPTL